MRKHSLTILLVTLAAASLSACSPKYNWRDYRSPDAPFAAMFPDKPATHTRTIDLDGQHVSMTMTAAQVDGTMFAVGSAELNDAAKAPAALAAMKTALVNNIGATVKSEKLDNGALAIEATGVQNGVPMLLAGRFVARDKRIYQVIVMGQAKAIVPEQVETFLTSFKLN